MANAQVSAVLQRAHDVAGSPAVRELKQTPYETTPQTHSGKTPRAPKRVWANQCAPLNTFTAVAPTI